MRTWDLSSTIPKLTRGHCQRVVNAIYSTLLFLRVSLHQHLHHLDVSLVLDSANHHQIFFVCEKLLLMWQFLSDVQRMHSCNSLDFVWQSLWGKQTKHNIHVIRTGEPADQTTIWFHVYNRHSCCGFIPYLIVLELIEFINYALHPKTSTVSQEFFHLSEASYKLISPVSTFCILWQLGFNVLTFIIIDNSAVGCVLLWNIFCAMFN